MVTLFARCGADLDTPLRLPDDDMQAMFTARELARRAHDHLAGCAPDCVVRVTGWSRGRVLFEHTLTRAWFHDQTVPV
jgi:hypothetical protein